MKDEVRRIMQMVKDGKLSPDDAAELIEAFQGSEGSERVEGGNDSGAQAQPQEEQASEEEPASKDDRLSGFVAQLEKMGKEVADSVNWHDVAKQVRHGVNKGVDAIRKATDDMRKGKGPLAVFGAHESKTVELPLDVPEGKILRIEGEAGDIKITGGKKIGKIVATATFRGHNEEEARAKAEGYIPVLEESEQFVLLRQPDGSDFSVDLEISVAKGVPVELRVQSGDIRVVDTRSSCRVTSRSGDVYLRGMDGTIDVSLYSGDVKIEDSKSSVMTVETKSGDVTLTDVKGVMNLRTSSGDVRITRAAGRTLSVEAASGDVSIDVREPVQGAINVRTVTGDARVDIAGGSDAQVMLSTLRGAVSSGVELDDLQQEGLKITGKLGKGNGSIDISSVNGDVHLGLRDSGADG
ncbi:MAG: DUF4097 family beta strand repeat protein [Armatimonadetes bacterium]|nr:DUF4097 family beta strand repeat protein [Armatimonadota bacterium]